MTDEQDGPVDLVDHALEIVAVAASQSSQRVRRSDDRQVFAEKLVVQAAKAGCVSERAVDENDGGITHFNHLAPSRIECLHASGDAESRAATWCAHGRIYIVAGRLRMLVGRL